MATTTLGVKLDDPTRERLKAAATSIDRTPHWLIKQAIFNYLEKLEGGATLFIHEIFDASSELILTPAECALSWCFYFLDRLFLLRKGAKTGCFVDFVLRCNLFPRNWLHLICFVE